MGEEVYGMGERRTCRERGGEGGRENVQWVSRVHYHGGLIQICLQERKRESKSTHNLVFVLKVERKATSARAEVTKRKLNHKVKSQNATAKNYL